MTLPKWWPAPALLVGLLLWRAHDGAVRREGVLKERIATLEEQAERLRQTEHGLDTVYRTDTIALTRWRTRYDSLRDTLRITDTLQVKQFVVTADSTIHACSDALTTCEKRGATLQALLTNMTKQRDAEKARRPGFLRRTFGCAAGLAATPNGSGLGAACGVRFP